MSICYYLAWDHIFNHTQKLHPQCQSKYSHYYDAKVDALAPSKCGERPVSLVSLLGLPK